MARFLILSSVGSAAATDQAGVLQHEGSGFVFMLGMIAMSVAILSLIIFGCADGIKSSPRKSHGGIYSAGATATVTWGASGGDGGGHHGGGHHGGGHHGRGHQGGGCGGGRGGGGGCGGSGGGGGGF